MITLELTEEEAQQMMLMIDLAVRAQGVRLAAQAAALAAKVEAAAKAEEAAKPTKAAKSVAKEKHHDPA